MTLADTFTESAPLSRDDSGRFKRILVALDASDAANRALNEAVRLAASSGGNVAGIHVYAAKMHDRRFRQMEGGLPEQFRKEDEMEHQRDVHDTLITKGLEIISDSYHDGASAACEQTGLPYRRFSPEGKNYRGIVHQAASGEHDLLAMGAVGLGVTPGSTVGTVCERVVRRSEINVLVVRDPERSLGDGPLVAAVDGSPRSFAALRAALDMGRRLGAPVHAVAAYDPYYHYVAFKKISGVLSEEAGKVFKFKEQEKLHEDIIDDGLAKIYQSHLEVARSVAEDEGTEITCRLLERKPYKAIADYLKEVNASLVLVGRTGVHADPDLDIGGNAENLLRSAPCSVWLGVESFTPPLDAVARETITWTDEAEARMDSVPEVAREMVRLTIVRMAQESGHTVVTSGLIDEAMDQFCPHVGGSEDRAAEQRAGAVWAPEAAALRDKVGDPTLAASVGLKAEKRARRENSATVLADHVRPFLDQSPGADLTWTAGALARLARLPQAERKAVRARTEARMEPACGKVTAADVEAAVAAPDTGEAVPLAWSPEAEAKMARIPQGFMREMTRLRVETVARSRGVAEVTAALVDDKYAGWGKGSAKHEMTLNWDDAAQARVGRIPDFVRGTVILEAERCARDLGTEAVSGEVLDKAIGVWAKTGFFHSGPNRNRYN